MAIEYTACRDGKGGLHSTSDNADLAGVLGRVGKEGGTIADVAKLLFEKREEIERVFAEQDRMIEAAATASDQGGDVIPTKEAK